MSRRAAEKRTAAQILWGDSLAVIAIIGFGPIAIGKLAGNATAVEALARCGMPASVAVAWGLAELVFLALSLFPRAQQTAMVLITANVAVATLLQIAEPAPLFGVALHLAAWGIATSMLRPIPIGRKLPGSLRSDAAREELLDRTVSMPKGVALEA